MHNSLVTGLTGLQANQVLMSIIGDNLANSSTPGYWGSRITFSDLLGFQLRPGSRPAGGIGGTNPQQIGLGVRVASIDMDTHQGVLQPTGKTFDLGIQGRGFFVLSNGVQNYYTRAGTFGFDEGNELVDLKTGYRVQSVSGSSIQIPFNEETPSSLTTQVTLRGNLSAKPEGPLAEVMKSTTAFIEGTSASLLGSVLPSTFTMTENSSFTIRVDGNAEQEVIFSAQYISDFNAVTADEVKAAIEDQVTGVTVEVTANNEIRITSNTNGNESTLDIEDGDGSPAAVLGLSTGFVSGVESTATASTDLNDLVRNLSNYSDGDRIILSGIDSDGTPINNTFTYGAGNDGTTLGDLVAFLGAQYASSTVELDQSGNIVVTAKETGEAELSLFLADHQNNTGSTNFQAFSVTTEGRENDTVTTSIEIYDSLGRSHTLRLTFERQETPNEWNLIASVDESDGVVLDGIVEGIRFNEDGSFGSITGSGSGDIEIQFNGLSNPQTIALDFGLSGEFEGLTQLGETNSAQAVDQDGYPPGSLATLGVDQNGTIIGFYTNGETRELDTIAIGVFSNPSGLKKIGDSLFEESVNSGAAVLGPGMSGGAGQIVSGVLEGSNVDIAQEFVRLIEAQRGFQANARMVSASDALIKEVLNLVR